MAHDEKGKSSLTFLLKIMRVPEQRKECMAADEPAISRLLQGVLAKADEQYAKTLSEYPVSFYYEATTPVAVEIDGKAAKAIIQRFGLRELSPGLYNPITIAYEGKFYRIAISQTRCG